MNIEEEWESFCNDTKNFKIIDKKGENVKKENIPKCTDIYISTKTNIIYLTDQVNLKDCFWKIPVINYCHPIEGVVKKQMKYNFVTTEEVSTVEEQLKKEKMVEQYSIIKNKSKNKFKDVRKISIGISKKDIINSRSKKKSAFYNCFVLLLRLNINGIFKEIHVKIFNTGKLEIPGIQTDLYMEKTLDKILNILNSICNMNTQIKYDTCDTVLINSNFKCGYYIHRGKLYDILKYKYKLHTSYDPCSYPGIMNKFWYNRELPDDKQSGIEIPGSNSMDISFMIFRTGSILIVGKCDEHILNIIYKFLINLFKEEYYNICQHTDIVEVSKEKKKRKKYIHIDVSV